MRGSIYDLRRCRALMAGPDHNPVACRRDYPQLDSGTALSRRVSQTIANGGRLRLVAIAPALWMSPYSLATGTLPPPHALTAGRVERSFSKLSFD